MTDSSLHEIRATYRRDVASLPDPATVSDPRAGWVPLRQFWLGTAPAHALQPGWARVSWNEQALLYEIVFAGSAFQNRARELNERTWELGDVAEIFVEAVGTGHYSEFHVTPENQRLQLRFPVGGIAEVRAGKRRLEEFLIPDPAWVHAVVTHRPGSWVVQASVPPAVVGVSHFYAGLPLTTAVCRYDYAVAASPPRLSSTALLSAPSFHQREEWSQLVLLSAAP